MMMKISDLKLPSWAVVSYADMGMKTLYQWQVECLNLPGVIDEEASSSQAPQSFFGPSNLVYTAPTSGGKTLVSEIIMMIRLFPQIATPISPKKKSISLFILPYVSVVNEKNHYFTRLFKKSKGSCQVLSFYGGSGTSPSDLLKQECSATVAVCTIEKANSIMNYLLEGFSLTHSACLVCTVLDEVHLISDENRGFLLEIVVAKIRKYSSQCQIIGMSATIPNISILAEWLNGKAYSTDYRPVPLTEYVVADKKVFSIHSGELKRVIQDGDQEHDDTDKDGFFALVMEVYREGHSVLVFCASKHKCESCAEGIARKFGSRISDVDDELTFEKREKVLMELRLSPGGLDSCLAVTVPMGIAFHHSGLTVEERSIIEKAYKTGVLFCLAATSTLAAGVNLPARRVIFRTPYIATEFLDARRYRQMAGRAGRAGQGLLGESYVMCNAEAQLKDMMRIVEDGLGSAKTMSALGEWGLQRLFLECMSSVGPMNSEDILAMSSYTLFISSEGDEERRMKFVHSSMRYLIDKQMIALDSHSQSYFATPLGRAVCASGLDCESGEHILRQLSTLRKLGISLESDLHLCFILCSVSGSGGTLSTGINWSAYFRAVESLRSTERRVLGLVGVKISLIQKASVSGCLPITSGASNEKISLVMSEGKRIRIMYSALLLWLMVHDEVPIPVLADKFRIPKGVLQSLRQNCGAFASSVATFCSKMRWVSLEYIIDSFSVRASLGLGKNVELAPLMQVPGMTVSFARELSSNGISTPALLTRLSVDELIKIVNRALPQSVPSLPSGVADDIILEAKHLVRNSNNLKKLSNHEITLITVSSRISIQETIRSENNGHDDNFAELAANIHLGDTPMNNKIESLSASNISKGLRRTGKRSYTTEELTDLRQVSPDRRTRRISGGSCGGNAPHTFVVSESALLLGDEGNTNVTAEDVAELSHSEDFMIASVSQLFQDLLDVTCLCLEVNESSDSLIVVLASYCGSEIKGRDSLSELLTLLKSVAGKGKRIIIVSSNVKRVWKVFLKQSLVSCYERLPSTVYWVDLNVATHLLDPDIDEFVNKSLMEESVYNQSKTLDAPRIFQQAIHTLSKGRSVVSALKEMNLFQYLLQFEMPLTFLIAEMEYSGMMVKSWKLSQFHVISKMHALEAAVDDLVGRKVQISNSEDVSRALFVDMGLSIPPGSKKVKKTGLLSDKEEDSLVSNKSKNSFSSLTSSPTIVSTAKDVLRYVDHPISRLIQEYRQLSGVLSHSIALSQSISDVDGRVHCDFSQAGTATGRLVSYSPNLLCVENVFVIEDVLRMSLQDEFLAGLNEKMIEGEKIILTSRGCTADKPRRYVEGELVKIHKETVYDFPDIRSDWISRKWEAYVNDKNSKSVFCCEVIIAGNVRATYPIDQVWRKGSSFRINSCLNDSQSSKIQVCLRDMFVTDHNKVILSIDYCQLEVRILAHLTRDEGMMNVFMSNNGIDIFEKIGALWLGKPKISPDERRGCKKLVYAILYGMSTRRLAIELDIDEDNADKLVDQFHTAFPKVRPWIDSTITQAMSVGFVESIGGRRRFLYGFGGSSANQRKAERQTINTICQASAADIMKCAMKRIANRIVQSNLQRDAVLLLQIHDELLFECTDTKVDLLRELVVSEMTRALLRVPLDVRWSVGESWGDMVMMKDGISINSQDSMETIP